MGGVRGWVKGTEVLTPKAGFGAKHRGWGRRRWEKTPRVGGGKGLIIFDLT